jgi:hypothetical protein
MSEETAVTAATPITSLKDLNALIQKRLKVEFDFNGTKCALEMRRLTAAESAKITEIIESVTPPVVKGRAPEEDRLDLTNAAYITKKNQAAIQARAMAIYWAFPGVAEGGPGLTDPGAVAEFVQRNLTEPVVDTLFTATRDDGVSAPELVNFS